MPGASAAPSSSTAISRPITADVSRSGASSSGSMIPTTVNHCPPSHTCTPSRTSVMPRRSAVTDPSTTTGSPARASSSHSPSAISPTRVSSSCVSAALTVMPPVWSLGARSVRSTVASTEVTDDTSSTGPMRRSMVSAVVGKAASSFPMKPPPASTTSRLVPSLSSAWSRLALDDSEMPSTDTMAAMPMAMPSADSEARSRRLRSPMDATRSRSPGFSELGARLAARLVATEPSPVGGPGTAGAGVVPLIVRPPAVPRCDHRHPRAAGVRLDQAIPQHHLAAQAARDVVVVGDDDDRRAFVVQLVEQVHEGVPRP